MPESISTVTQDREKLARDCAEPLKEMREIAESSGSAKSRKTNVRMTPEQARAILTALSLNSNAQMAVRDALDIAQNYLCDAVNESKGEIQENARRDLAKIEAALASLNREGPSGDAIEDVSELLRQIANESGDSIFWQQNTFDGLARDIADRLASSLNRVSIADETLAEKLIELRDFLNGEIGIEDVWFGDRHPRSRQPLWWRDWMRETIDAAIAALSSTPTPIAGMEETK